MSFHRKLFLLLVLFLPVQLGFHFWPNWSFLFGLRIDYLSPTLYFTDLLIFSILIFWIKDKIDQKKRLNLFFPIKRNFLYSLLIFLFLLINCPLAKNRPAAFLKLFKISELFFLGLYLVKEKISLKEVARPLVWAMFFSSLIGLAQFLKQSSLNGFFWWLGERTFSLTTPGIARGIWQGNYFLRPYATFSHPNSFAGFLLVGLIMALPYLTDKKRFRPVLFFGLIFLVLVVLILCFSRTIWLTGFLIFLVYFFFFNRKKSLNKKGFLTGFILLIILIIAVFLVRNLGKNLLTDESFLRRQNLNNLAWQMIFRSPFLGVGLNNFLPEMVKNINQDENFYWLQPVHNIFLLIASESGLIGLTIVFLLLKNVFDNLSKQLNNKNKLFLSLAIMAVLITGLTDHYWLTLQQNQILLTLLFGLLLAK